MRAYKGFVGSIWLGIWLLCIWKLCTSCTSIPKADYTIKFYTGETCCAKVVCDKDWCHASECDDTFEYYVKHTWLEKGCK